MLHVCSKYVHKIKTIDIVLHNRVGFIPEKEYTDRFTRVVGQFPTPSATI